MGAYTVTTKFEMQDGRVLSCEYGVSYTPAYISGPPEDCYPEESDAGDPTYFIDGDEIEYKDLPKGLAVIADKLYEAGPGEYGYSQTEPDYDGPDYEPDYY